MFSLFISPKLISAELVIHTKQKMQMFNCLHSYHYYNNYKREKKKEKTPMRIRRRKRKGRGVRVRGGGWRG